MMILTTLLLAPEMMPSTPDLGKAEAQCRPGESGPALLVGIEGLKDRGGRLKLEVYPSREGEFLADDNVLLSQGKTFRRVEQAPPASGPIQICVRVPRAGAYSESLLHDRDADRKFGLSVDGIGFTGNPRLRLSKPSAAQTRIVAGAGLTRTEIVVNYRQGLFSFAPLKGRGQ